MSRIAGVLEMQSGNTDGNDWCRAMLNAAATAVCTRGETVSSAGVCLGWVGWNEPRLGDFDGVLVGLDGVFYNRESLPDGASDAQRFAELFRQRGFEAALQAVNGDFAVALYNTRDRNLWLGRDRFGVKPLYYAQTQGLFGFASRLRSLLRLPGVRPEPDVRYLACVAASHYRTFDNDWQASPLRDVQQVPPAHYLHLRDGVITIRQYWNFQETGDWDLPEAELAGRYRELLLDAVARRLKVGRKRAFTLSGGMDSSSVLACAVALTGEKQHAFSTVYDDRTYDESPEIQTILNQTVREWHAVRVDEPDLVNTIERMIAVHDEPVATATWLSHFVLCEQAAAAGFDSLFGGLGGDELNAGEYEHFFFFFADLHAVGEETLLDHEVACWIKHHDHLIFKKDRSLMEQTLRRVTEASIRGRCLPDRERIVRYAAALNADYFDLRSWQPVMDHPFQSYLKNRTAQDLWRETIPCCLRAEDRHGAAFGIEHFQPFFDYRLVEFMYRVPGHMQFRDGVSKRLLREAMRGILPEPTRTRIKKTGWNAPAHRWFAGRGRELLLDLLHSVDFRARDLYYLPEVLRLLDEHEAIIREERPQDNHMMFFWQLLNVELWLRTLEREANAQTLNSVCR
jgi:asparagine synthase (glutamine-hydrolysing)